jgi:hypothetical protein
MNTLCCSVLFEIVESVKRPPYIGEDVYRMKEDPFSFATFCYVYLQNWRLLKCYDFREILYCFVLSRFVF